ncbi:MAG: cellulase family glycosylhydrolase [Halorhabdus sp.]
MSQRRTCRGFRGNASTDGSLSRRQLLALGSGATAGLAGCTGSVPLLGDGGAPPVRIEDGTFVRDGSPMFPHGFNYIRVRQHPDGYPWHDTFNPDSYDPEESESMFAHLEEHGFNLVRVFVDHIAGPGVIPENGATNFSEPYMANVFDFLERARNHGVAVILTFPWLPRRQSYNELTANPLSDVAEANRLYLDGGHIDAKAQYVADFASAIESYDAGLLPAVFGYHLANEAAVVVDQPPFSLAEGTLTPATGETYDLASTEDLTAMVDENVNYWVDTCAAAIREVDPEALVTVDVYPYNAVGREGPGDFSTDGDPRYPARPLALAESAASYLDVHLYTAYPGTLSANLESIEFEQVRTRAGERGLPLLMGEFGAFTNEYLDRETAASAMVERWRQVHERGFAGYAYWTYKDNGQPLYGATSGEGQIFEALAGTST